MLDVQRPAQGLGQNVSSVNGCVNLDHIQLVSTKGTTAALAGYVVSNVNMLQLVVVLWIACYNACTLVVVVERSRRPWLSVRDWQELVSRRVEVVL